MTNPGKIFENDYSQSVKDNPYLLNIRLHDEAASFNKTARFSHKNICDFILFDTRYQILCFLELKSTKSKSISFEDIFTNTPQTHRMIHKHQILGLSKVTRYNHIHAGFLCNFRDEHTREQVTYYIDINSFINMTQSINKRSFNIKDLLTHGAHKIEGYKKRTRYTWNIAKLLTELTEENNAPNTPT